MPETSSRCLPGAAAACLFRDGVAHPGQVQASHWPWALQKPPPGLGCPLPSFSQWRTHSPASVIYGVAGFLWVLGGLHSSITKII